MRGLLFILLLAQAAGPTPSAPGGHYAVVTKDGGVLDAAARPKRVGKRVDVVLAGSGILTSLRDSDVDWEATEKLNAEAARSLPVPGPTGPVATPSFQDVAASMKLDGQRAMKAQEQKNTIVTQDGKTLDVGGHRFAADSVMKSMDSLKLRSDLADCPRGRAQLHASLRNAGKVPLRNLRAMLVLGDPGTGRSNEIVASFDPPDLMPGETGEVSVRAGCEWARPNGQYVFSLADVAGKMETASRVERK